VGSTVLALQLPHPGGLYRPEGRALVECLRSLWT
jgi:hypothetical protein